MSFLSYGGIVLEFQNTEELSFDAVYEGLDYIYTSVTIKIDCVFNPNATSYLNQASQGQTPDPVQYYGEQPTDTLTAIRNALLQPRNQLVFSNGDYLIYSPLDGVQTDITGGPFPQNLEIKEIQGEQTFLVSYTVKTDINECYLSSPILSNRWSSTWDTDSQMRNRITYNGKAKLGLNALLFYNFNPGQFVSSILPYVQPFYYRDHINIHYDEDQQTIIYQASDIERRYYSLGDLTNPTSPAALFGVTSFTAKIVNQTVQIQGDYGISMANPGFSQVTLEGEVLGNETSTRGGLLEFALTLANEKLGGVLGLNFAGLLGTKVEGDYDQPRITFSINVLASVAQIQPGVVAAPQPVVAPVGWTGSLNQALLFTDVSVNFLDQFFTNPQLTWGGVQQLRDNTLTPVFQSILAACTSPCNLAVPFSYYSDVCNGPAINGYSYLTTPIVNVQNNPPQTQPTTNTSYSGAAAGTYIYEINKRTWTRYNTFVSPTTSPPPSSGNYNNNSIPSWNTVDFDSRNSAEVLCLGSPISGMDVHWSAQSIGAPPPIPSPIYSDQNVTMVDSLVEVYPVPVAADGTSNLYRIDGVYKFVNKTPVQPGDQLGGSALPFLTLTFDDNSIGSELWIDGIIDQGGSEQSPGGSSSIVN